MMIEEGSASTHYGVEAKQIREEVGPTIEKRRGWLFEDTLGAREHRGVYQLFTLFWIGVVDKLTELLGLRQPPRQVQGNTPQEFCVRAKHGMGNLVLLDLSKNVFVDVVPFGDRNGGRER